MELYFTNNSRSKSQRSSPTSSAITSETESHPPLPNKSKKIKSREDEKYGSKKQNVKTRPNKSQGSESKWMSKSGSIFKMVAAVTSPPRNSTSVSSQSKRVLQLASKRRVSWGGSSEATAGITPILSEYSNPINPKKSLSISLERTELPSILRAMHGGISNIESRGGKAGSRRKLLNSMILWWKMLFRLRVHGNEIKPLSPNQANFIQIFGILYRGQSFA